MADNPLNKHSKFGRKWRISVFTNDGDEHIISTSETEATGALHCTFEIDKPPWRTPNYSDITIYNLSTETENLIVEKGQTVVVAAGYNNGPYGIIFKGKLLQPIRDRRDVVDYTLTLHCMDGYDKLIKNIIRVCLDRGMKAEDVINHLAEDSSVIIPIQYITRDLQVHRLSRSKVMFGDTADFLTDVAIFNNSNWFINDESLYFGKLTDRETEGDIFEYSSDTGLIEVPQQTQSGVNFKVLLDPRLMLKIPIMQVKLTNTLVKMQKRYQGDTISRPLNTDFLVAVAGIRHVGDTRGNDWHTYVTGFNSMEKLLAMLTTKDTEGIH